MSDRALEFMSICPEKLWGVEGQREGGAGESRLYVERVTATELQPIGDVSPEFLDHPVL